jgi:hypothetical protein
MAIDIFWANEQHGDADNVWKGIADALFENNTSARLARRWSLSIQIRGVEWPEDACAAGDEHLAVG